MDVLTKEKMEILFQLLDSAKFIGRIGGTDGMTYIPGSGLGYTIFHYKLTLKPTQIFLYRD